MKRLLKFFCGIFIIVVCLCVGLVVLLVVKKDIFIHKIANQLIRSQFPDSTIHIGEVVFEMPDELHFYSVSINHPSTRTIVTLQSLLIEFEPGKLRHSITHSDYFGVIKRISLKADKLYHQVLFMKDVAVSFELSSTEPLDINGICSVGQWLYQRFSLADVRGEFVATDKSFSLSLNKVGIGAGYGQGVVDAGFSDEQVSYEAKLYLSRLDSEGIITILDLQDRMHLTGLWDGEISVSGTEAGVSDLNGLLIARAQGGTLNLIDRVMAEKMLPQNQQYSEKLLDSIMFYTYTEGEMDISLEGMSILFELKLKGETGKRNFSIYLHDLL